MAIVWAGGFTKGWVADPEPTAPESGTKQPSSYHIYLWIKRFCLDEKIRE